jgi:hypothetical protein
MPNGKPGLAKPPAIRPLAGESGYWHVYHLDYPPLSPNPYSKARLALVDPVGGKTNPFGMV